MNLKLHFKKLNYIGLAILLSVPALMSATDTKGTGGGCVQNSGTAPVTVNRKRGVNFDIKINDFQESTSFAIFENRESLKKTNFLDRPGIYKCGDALETYFFLGLLGNGLFSMENTTYKRTLVPEFTIRKEDLGGFFEIVFLGDRQTAGSPKYDEADGDQRHFRYAYTKVVAANPSDRNSVQSVTYIACLDIPGLPKLDAPSALSGSTTGTSSTMTWSDNSSASSGTPTAGLNTDRTNEDGFIIERSTDNATFTKVGQVGPNVTTFTETVMDSTTYYYRVAAFDKFGSSDYSNIATVSSSSPTLTPTAPTLLSATAISSSQIDLSWTNNATNEDGFKVERGTDGVSFTEIVGNLPIGTTTYSDTTGLSAATQYYYRVRAYNGSGNSAYTNAATATTSASAPAAPSLLLLSNETSNSIQLNWTDNSSNETGFKVEQSLDNVSWAEIATVASPTTTYTDGSLAPMTQYYYRVRAYNIAGNSAYTSTVSTMTLAPTPPTPPAAPSALVGFPDPMSPPDIMLTWADNSSDETGFEIERSTTGGGVGFANITTTPANASSYSDTTASPGTTYYYRVRAVNMAGDSSYTTEASVVNP